MTTKDQFKQSSHNTLLIPGPIEVSDDVLFANAHPSVSHTSPAFAAVFQSCLRKLREILMTRDGQPFLVAGSGTLGWDMVASNLVEPGEHALVLNAGYFGDSFADCLEVYGAKVTQLKAPIGDRPGPEQLEEALKKQKFKIVTFTHVDTSTGVLTDAKMVAEAVHQQQPDALIILDGVCSVGSEEIRFDDWGIDFVVSASQKGLGTPPGLSVTCASQKALKVLKNRKSPVTSYFADLNRWLPIMNAYDEGKAAYFATPPVNLVNALHTSLVAMTEHPPTLSERFALHKQTSERVKAEGKKLGLKEVALHPHAAANGMTAFYAPEGTKPTDIVPGLLKRGVVVAAGLHKEIKDKYFRIGHMGESAVNRSRPDIDKVLAALREALVDAGHKPPQ